MTAVPFHRLASLFPLLEGDEFDALVESVRANGLREPITLLEDRILDGRNRYRACEAASVEPRFRRFEGASPLMFVLDMNLKRRHLSASQRAALAFEVLPELEKEARKRAGGRPSTKPSALMRSVSQGKASDAAAALVGVSPRYVEQAKRIAAEAPEVFAEVRAGDKTLTEAARALRESKRDKRRAENRQLVAGAVPLTDVARTFPTLVVDPPWDWGDEGDVNQLGRAKHDYAAMPLEEIERMPIGDMAEPNAHLYLWITNRSLPKGFALIESWGFRYVTALTWVKPHYGMGNYFRGQTEHVLFAVRGSLALLRKDVGTWFAGDRPGPHSAKPDEFYRLIESCSPGPWLDVWGRKARPGWVVWGEQGISAA